MHPFLLIYSVISVIVSSFLFLVSKHLVPDFLFGFFMFAPCGILLLMNFRENRYPIFLFIRRPDFVRLKKRLPVFDKYLVGAMIFGLVGNIVAQPEVFDEYAFYAGGLLNMIWPILDLTGPDAMERHPIIWRKP